MLKNIFLLLFLLQMFLFFPVCVPAKTLNVETAPRIIGPGDVFYVKLTGAENSTAPLASFEGDYLNFSGCGDGCYIAIGAVDIKSEPGPHLVRLKLGGKRMDISISVKAVKFPELKLTLPAGKVILSPGDLERARREDIRLGEIFRTVSTRMWEGGFVKPLENELATVFGTRRNMNGEWVSVHKGVDIRGKEGEMVRASNTGRVVLAESLFFGGNTVIVDHGQGIYTIYMHLSKFRVNAGEIVSKGDIVGLVGSSGRATGPHLHFGAKVMNISVNPISLMDLKL